MNRWQWLGIALALVGILLGISQFLFSPPVNFPNRSIVVIDEGASAHLIAEQLSSADIIKHKSLFEIVLRVSGKSDNIQSGSYLFEKPQNVFIIAYRIIVGDFGMPLSKITFPEGTTVNEMAVQIAEMFPSISKGDFLKVAEPYDGYLFPDTYFFSQIADAESIVKMMRENFNTKIKSISADIMASGHSISDIVIMASLIEKEARTSEDKHIVAGILWNRIKIGMPLQVDAARETYSHKDLPPSPICNPGLDSIEAAVNPTKTNYLYYLTGKDGLMHYATTFAGHQSNLKKYLN